MNVVPARQLSNAGVVQRLMWAFLVLVLVVAGATGMVQYIQTYWLYRGFAAPSVPAMVVVPNCHHGSGKTCVVKVVQGSLEEVEIPGAALAGHSEPAFVYLPPGYFQHPSERYPVFYILHGAPGGPINFVHVIPMGDEEDILVAEHLMRPMILVGPTGTPTSFGDTEWANISRGNDWTSYVARDVVRYIDHTFRTIASPADRAIGGLSEGGYGALNIALHYPREFSVIESWSGYMTADAGVRSVWGAHPSAERLAANSPAVEIQRLATLLRRQHVYIWFYCGRSDPLVGQNRHFAAELASLGIASHFQAPKGGHTWVLWRGMARDDLLVVSEHFTSA